MICMQPTSSIYGSAPYYANVGKMDNKGVELSVQASLVRTRDFEWIVGGNIAHYDDKSLRWAVKKESLTETG